MDHFQIRDGVMHAEDVNLAALAKQVGTPFYCYSSATMERHFTVFRDAVAGLGDGNPLVAFAVKAKTKAVHNVIDTLLPKSAGRPRRLSRNELVVLSVALHPDLTRDAKKVFALEFLRADNALLVGPLTGNQLPCAGWLALAAALALGRQGLTSRESRA